MLYGCGLFVRGWCCVLCVVYVALCALVCGLVYVVVGGFCVSCCCCFSVLLFMCLCVFVCELLGAVV